MKIILPKISEHQLQTLLMNYLTANGWYVMRLNSGAIKATNKYGNQHMMRLSPAGTPDLMAFTSRRLGQLLFIEVKTPQNPKPTFAQEQKMKELEEHGARCLVVHSLEELQKQL